MTVQTEFYNYQQNSKKYDPDEFPFDGCGQAAKDMRTFLEEQGFVYLGCKGSRPIRGGTSLSTHSFGAAPDMRYQNPGPGLQFVDEKIIPMLIANSKELGIQAIHHYFRALIWRPPGTSGRPVGSDGWKIQATNNPNNNMGKPWAFWIHVEFLPERLDVSILSLLKKLVGEPDFALPDVPPIIPTTPPVKPELIPGKINTMNVSVPTIRKGSQGAAVITLQEFFNDRCGRELKVDGQFGPATEEAAEDFQTFFGMNHIDGIVGAKTWSVVFLVMFRG